MFWATPAGLHVGLEVRACAASRIRRQQSKGPATDGTTAAESISSLRQQYGQTEGTTEQIRNAQDVKTHISYDGMQ